MKGYEKKKGKKKRKGKREKSDGQRIKKEKGKEKRIEKGQGERKRIEVEKETAGIVKRKQTNFKYKKDVKYSSNCWTPQRREIDTL